MTAEEIKVIVDDYRSQDRNVIDNQVKKFLNKSDNLSAKRITKQADLKKRMVELKTNEDFIQSKILKISNKIRQIDQRVEYADDLIVDRHFEVIDGLP